ncbi:uncharacterized protein LOC114172513 [Vigna unguiculata]|uniref:uncharacterized protein LOC114172513 n=1 Tax=Vigna unguiculata TaxID=3917 RepID=UPI0010171F71|nr:uncharacterized protein LOC114172513 [Vigna unguiculata]
MFYYKDTFLTRVFTRDDCQQPFWKETFLAGLPKSLGDKVREKIRTQFNGEIPYNQLSYGQLIAYIQKVGLKICQDEKIQNQLAREKAQNRKDLGSFCQQFGLPCSDKPSGSRTKSRKTQRFHKSRTQDNHPVKPHRSDQHPGPELNGLVTASLNPIEAKQKQINFLKDDLSFETIRSQLTKSSIQTKISNLHTRIQNTVCSELPNAFWERKKHMVDLPYEKDFNDRLIPTKARPIQMSLELVRHSSDTDTKTPEDQTGRIIGRRRV